MGESKMFRFNENNFDLIRLFAAVQVAVHHAAYPLKVHNEPIISGILKLLNLFPGVPIFFFISRFFESNSKLRHYPKNRVLRLFPGLIVCGIVTVVVITMSGYFNEVDVSASALAVMSWFLVEKPFMKLKNQPLNPLRKIR